MPEFRGNKNLHIGSPAWAEAEYDPETRDYVITLDAAGAKKFNALPDKHKHGFAEVKQPRSDS